MESLLFVVYSLGLRFTRNKSTETELCVHPCPSPVSSSTHLDAPGVHSLAHIAGAPPGRGHDWTPESRPRLGFNIIIFDPNHPNPFKGMVMALSERVPSHNIDHEHSTSIEEQAVAAALNTLSRIGSHNAEYIISSDSLACLMAIKNMCLSRGQLCCEPLGHMIPSR
jgi:hypothetical protein